MNKKQKIIIAIAVPIILFLITVTIAYYIGETASGPGKIGMGKPRFPTTYTNNPFLWSLTWYVWITYFIIIFIFEYKFFSDKNIPNNKKK